MTKYQELIRACCGYLDDKKWFDTAKDAEIEWLAAGLNDMFWFSTQDDPATSEAAAIYLAREHLGQMQQLNRELKDLIGRD